MPAFNLPPPWAARYALPDYVDIEDMQRRTFVTRQMPRGWYDDPEVGTAGYKVPQYAIDEGYGQGAAITKWAPRGTAPRVDHFVQIPRARLVGQVPAQNHGTNYVITSGTPPTDPFQAYGVKVADHVLTNIKRLPAAARKPALKSLMDRIDPKLWSRVSATASKAAKAGVPAARALHHAIAVHFHGGIVRELNTIGATGKVKTASQVGLGCYGCAAIGMGDIKTVAAVALPVGNWQRATASQTAAGLANSCGYVWVGTGTPPAMANCTPARVHTAGDTTNPAPSGAAVTALPYCGTKDAAGNPIAPCNPTVPAGFGQQPIVVGPFSFDSSATVDSRNTWTDPSQVPAPVLAYLKAAILAKGATSGGPDVFSKWFGKNFGFSAAVPQFYPDQDNYSTGNAYPVNPIVNAIVHPYFKTGYGVFLFINGDALSVKWAPYALHGTTTTGDVINAVGSVLQSIADGIASLACGAVNAPGAVQASAAGGPYAAAGTVVTKGICPANTTATPLVAPLPSSGISMLEVLLLGGAGVAAYILLR